MNHPSVKYGVLGGFVSIILTLVLWFINPDYLLNYVGSFAGFFITIYFMYLAGKEARELSGGYINFGEIFKYLFITFVIMSLISVIFTYILYNFIDTGMIERQKEMAIKAAEKMSSLITDENVLDEINDKLEEQDFSYTIGTALQGWVFGIIFGAIIAAIQGAIMKKKDPGFNQFA